MKKREWFRDSIPLDPLIAPMVFFLNDHGIRTINSCQGGPNHLYGRPTIGFEAESREEITRVYELLRDNDLHCSAQVCLETGFFQWAGMPSWRGQVSWLWEDGDKMDTYRNEVYPGVMELVKMEKSMIATPEYLTKWYSKRGHNE